MKSNSNAFTSISNANSNPDGSGKKMRKPYTISKSRESWTEEEHDKFIEALQLFDRDWKKIEDFVASKTVIQIRSHAQKYFLKVQKNGTVAHVPPPRPKRKATHPYPQKTSKNVSMQLPFSSESPNVHVPACDPWDDVSLMTPRMGNCNISGVQSSTTMDPIYEITSSVKQAPVLHATPDFAEVYSFIGGIFDPETEGHAQKLKEMDPINFEAVLLLMKNLTINMSSPDFEPNIQIFSSYDVSTKNDRVAPEIDVKQTDDLSCQTN